MRTRRTIAPAATAAVLAVATAGCGPGSAGANPGAATPTPGVTATADAAPNTTPSAGPRTTAAKTITVRIADGKVTPQSGRIEVAKGDTVRLVVTSDVPDEVHVHGYELEAPLRPGVPATLEFTADRTGLFEVETHESGLILFQLLVR